MSSTSSLSRTRSMRKPAAGGHEFGKKDGPATRSEARTTSPSRLPVKPTMTTRSAAANSSSNTATSTTTTRHTRAPSSTTGRPLSGVYSKPPLTTLGNGATRALGRAASTRQPPSSTTTGGTSTIARTASTTTGRPRSSGGPPPTTSSNRLMGHSRSKSTVTSLTSATTLRPRPISSQQSSHSSGRSSPTASTISAASSKPPTKPPTRSHTRAKSQSQTSSSSISSNQLPPSSRPAFNTHQQHYSPAKSLAPKPLTSTYLAPPSPSKLPANVALSAETSRLQTELLQLSLLSRDAAEVDAEWRESARQKLGARFAAVAADNEALLQLERRGVEARNVAALVRWGGEGADTRRTGRGLEEKVQILDEVLNGVWALGEPGGRYERIVHGFETWADQMAGIVAAQRGGDADALVDGEEIRFLSELDQSWKHDGVSLARKLEGWRALLYELGDVEDDDQVVQRSGVAKMLEGCRALVHDMLSELAVMEQIERDAKRAEDAWIESTNRAIEDEADDTPAARAYVPLWKLAV